MSKVWLGDTKLLPNWGACSNPVALAHGAKLEILCRKITSLATKKRTFVNKQELQR